MQVRISVGRHDHAQAFLDAVDVDFGDRGLDHEFIHFGQRDDGLVVVNLSADADRPVAAIIAAFVVAGVAVDHQAVVGSLERRGGKLFVGQHQSFLKLALLFLLGFEFRRLLAQLVGVHIFDHQRCGAGGLDVGLLGVEPDGARVLFKDFQFTGCDLHLDLRRAVADAFLFDVRGRRESLRDHVLVGDQFVRFFGLLDFRFRLFDLQFHLAFGLRQFALFGLLVFHLSRAVFELRLHERLGVFALRDFDGLLGDVDIGRGGFAIGLGGFHVGLLLGVIKGDQFLALGHIAAFRHDGRDRHRVGADFVCDLDRFFRIDFACSRQDDVNVAALDFRDDVFLIELGRGGVKLDDVAAIQPPAGPGAA